MHTIHREPDAFTSYNLFLPKPRSCGVTDQNSVRRQSENGCRTINYSITPTIASVDRFANSPSRSMRSILDEITQSPEELAVVLRPLLGPSAIASCSGSSNRQERLQNIELSQQHVQRPTDHPRPNQRWTTESRELLHGDIGVESYLPPSPPSTHMLQPLDVVLFKHLSSAYSDELSNHLQRSQSLVHITKGDFFPFFWRAWLTSFKEKTILKSFEATGISPANADVILQRFAHQQQDEQEPSRSSSRLSPSDWRQMDRLIRSAVRDNAIEDGRKVSASLHHLQVENELLHDENKSLIEALKVKK